MDRFIIGTGRCGSTLLSQMLAAHGSTLSISEFFPTLDRKDLFSAQPKTGAQVIAQFARSNLLNDLITAREGCFDDKAVARYGREVGAYARAGYGLPAMQLELSQYTQDPVGLFTDLKNFLRPLPARPLADHYRAVFGWLAARFGKQQWIERSGASLEYFCDMVRLFPDARYVHIHRDGPVTALAIRAFRHFALYCSFHEHPPSAEELRHALFAPIDPATDPIVRRLTRDLPSVEAFGRYWSWQIARLYAELPKLRPDQFLAVRYEDLVASPERVLQQIADFFDLPPDPGWTARAAAKVDPDVVTNRLQDLGTEEQAKLVEACRPGQVLLGRDTVNHYAQAITHARDIVESERR